MHIVTLIVMIRAFPGNELSQSVVEMRTAVFFQAAFIQARIFAHLITTSLM